MPTKNGCEPCLFSENFVVDYHAIATAKLSSTTRFRMKRVVTYSNRVTLLSDLDRNVVSQAIPLAKLAAVTIPFMSSTPTTNQRLDEQPKVTSMRVSCRNDRRANRQKAASR